MNTSYSTIEEAWADSYLSPTLQKKTKKKRASTQPDPICELYEMGNNHYDEYDIISYANQFYEKHEKAKYQKPRMHEREKLPKIVDIDVSDDISYPPMQPEPASQPEEPKNMISYEDDSEDEVYEPSPRQTPRDNIIYDTKEYYDDNTDFGKKNQSFHVFDILLYITSGIILIFMMEQFVKIGTLLR